MSSSIGKGRSAKEIPRASHKTRRLISSGSLWPLSQREIMDLSDSASGGSSP